MKKICKNCKFIMFDADYGQSTKGITACYCYPPTRSSIRHDIIHPSIDEDQWCSEFQEKDPPCKKSVCTTVKITSFGDDVNVEVGDLVGILPNGRGVGIVVVGRCYEIGCDVDLRRIKIIDLEGK